MVELRLRDPARVIRTKKCRSPSAEGDDDKFCGMDLALPTVKKPPVDRKPALSQSRSAIYW